MEDDRIDCVFAYHTPFGDQPERYETIRGKAKSLAHTIQECCPESREKSLALTNLQQAVMWANASIAIIENLAKDLCAWKEREAKQKKEEAPCSG